MFRKTSRCFFIFCTKKIEDIQELVFCVSARLLWNAGNYRFLYFNLLFITSLFAILSSVCSFISEIGKMSAFFVLSLQIQGNIKSSFCFKISIRGFSLCRYLL
jgi:hypothetical protein